MWSQNTHVRAQDLYEEREPKDKEYDDARDKYAFMDQLWRSAEIVKRFNIKMRLDPVKAGVSMVNSVIRTRNFDPNFRKKSPARDVRTSFPLRSN